MISQACKNCNASGWCEYDPITDTIYPNNEGACPERMEKTMAEFDLAAFAKDVHENAVAHGWWEGKRSEEEVRALIHSEWSEALEEARAGRPMEWYTCKHGDRICEPDWNCVNKVEECPMRIAKPEGIAVELIDGVIRILDLLGKEEFKFEDDLLAVGARCLTHACGKGQRAADITVAELIDYLHYGTARDADEPDHAGYVVAVGSVFAWLEAKGVNPEAILLRKHAYNKTRPYKHGKKF